MMAFLIALAALGWAAAAFLAGWRVGEHRGQPGGQAPARQPSRTKPAAQQPSPAQQEAARRAVQAWQNFLRYDGSAQDGEE